MNTCEQIKSEILRINKTIHPDYIKMHELRGSDGLVGTYQEHVYGKAISSIREKIWSSGLALKEKLQLNEALASKMKL